jgi:two-component system, NarL family, response regulator NreC
VRISILIADDHTILRSGLRSLLNAEPDLNVIGEAADGGQAVILAAQLKPDVVVTDINMPVANGIWVTQELHDQLPSVRVLILSMHEDSSLVRQAFEAGASGYIVKRAIESELVSAVRAVAQGGTYLHSALQGSLPRDLLHNAVVVVPGADSLCEDERKLLRLLATGYTNRQIAEQLRVDLPAATSLRAELCDKLGLHSRVDLLKYAREQGLLDL